MSRIRTRVVSTAPLDVLFKMGHEVHRFPEIFPNLKNIKVMEISEDGSFVRAEWTAEARPIRKKRIMTWVQEDRWDDADRCCRFQCTRDGRGHFKYMKGTWEFRPLGDGTEMIMDVDYEMDHPLLKIHPIAIRMIDNIMKENNESLLRGLKEKAEREMKEGAK